MNAFPRYFRTMCSAAILCLVMIGLRTNAQIDCTIYPGDTTVCYGDNIYLYTQFSDTLKYYWEPTGQTGVIIEVDVKDTITYVLKVYNSDSSFFCTDTVTISVYPKMVVEFEQLSKGCPDECKAQVQAYVSGGTPPYKYVWIAPFIAPNDSSLALGLCSEDSYTFLVYDTICSYDTSYLVESYQLPDILLHIEPEDIYQTNPKAIMTYENKSADSIPLSSWTWVFPDKSTTNDLMPEYAFVDSVNTVEFRYTTIDNCQDTLFLEVRVKEFELQIPNVFTPNGDGVNDIYEIPNLDRYISNEIVIFNRWGHKVFEAKNYNNNWDGGTLPDGVYFYILRCQGYWREDIYRGAVSIYGSRY